MLKRELFLDLRILIRSIKMYQIDDTPFSAPPYCRGHDFQKSGILIMFVGNMNVFFFLYVFMFFAGFVVFSKKNANNMAVRKKGGSQNRRNSCILMRIYSFL